MDTCSPNLVNVGLLLRGAKFFHRGHRTLFVAAERKLEGLGIWLIDTYNDEFRELFSAGPVIPCGDMHQSLTDALVYLLIMQVSLVDLLDLFM